jgi:hypothetical protein
VEQYKIPVSGTSRDKDLKAKLDDFAAKWDYPHCLTIFIYSGNGAEEAVKSGKKGDNAQERSGRFRITQVDMWLGTPFLTDIHSDEFVEGPEVNWLDVSELVNFQLGDVLYIFEPIGASTMALKRGPEMLAFANEGAATCRLDHFTDKLVELQGVPWAVSHIYADMHRDALGGKIEAPPIYVAHPTKRSIVLQRWEGQVMAQWNEGLHAPNLGSWGPSTPWVVLSVRLEDAAHHSYEGWDEWIWGNVGIDYFYRSGIQVIRQYDGAPDGTSILQIEVPLIMWQVLEPNDAYEFTGERVLERVHG